MPQALRIIVPALVGECDQLLKSTAVVSAIGVFELTGAGRNIITQEMNPIAIYTILALAYLSMSTLLAQFARWLERRLAV
jgi:ABC-type amino acid transport system permease subunit